jgi:hypothetical protein
MKLKKRHIFLLILGSGILLASCDKKDMDIDLTSSEWKVEKIRKSGQLIYSGTDSTYVLRFTSETEYTLNLDVNACIGLYRVTHRGCIAIQPMACTEICCDSDFAWELAELFPEMSSYFLRDNRLHFQGEGEIILLPL